MTFEQELDALFATRVGALTEALRAVLALPCGQDALALLDRGIGTSTPNKAWLEARELIEAPD